MCLPKCAVIGFMAAIGIILVLAILIDRLVVPGATP